MKKLLEPRDHYFMEGVIRVEIGPQPLSLELDESQKKAVREWEEFMKAKNVRLPARDKVTLATRKPWNLDSGTLAVSAFPVEYRYIIAAVDTPARYYGHKKPPKLEGLDIYALSISGINRVTGYPGVLFGSRTERRLFEQTEERIDTVPSAVLDRGDRKQQDPFGYRFMQEAGKNSVQPDSIRKYGVIKSDEWSNIIQCFEADTPMDKIERDFEIYKEEWGLRLKRKVPKEGKYSSLFICPEERLEKYALRMRGKLSDRTRCILKDYLERTGR